MKSLAPTSSILALLIWPVTALAQEIQKADNTTALNQTGSWTGASVPGPADVAVWASPYNRSPSLASTLGASASWAGIKVTDPLQTPRIRNTTGATLTLGAAGIDLSAATRDFELYCAATLGASQVWQVPAGRLLTANNLEGGAGFTLTKSGTGTLALTGATTLAAHLAISGGTLRAAPATGVATWSGALSGGGAVEKLGLGSLTLSGTNNAFSGTLGLLEGALGLSHAQALGGATVVINGGTLQNDTGGPLVLAGAGAIEFRGAGGFSGMDAIDLGSRPLQPQDGADRALLVNAPLVVLRKEMESNAAGVILQGGGVLELAATAVVAPSGRLRIESGTLRVSGAEVDAGWQSGNLELAGSGVLELDGGSVTARAVAGSGGTLRFDGGVLRPKNNNGAFMGGLSQALVEGGGAVIDLNGCDVTVSQPLLHDPSLGATPDGGLRVVNGMPSWGGTLLLTGACTYTGPTVIEDGALALGAGGSISVSPLIELGPDGVFDAGTAYALASGQTLAGTGAIEGNLTVGAGATLSPGGSGIATLRAEDSLTLAGTALFQTNKTGMLRTSDRIAGTSLRVKFGGTLTVTHTGGTLANGDTFQLFEAAEYSGSFSSLSLPSPGAGLYWDTSQLTVDGSIKVSNQAPAPVFNPPGGGYFGQLSVTISSEPGSVIHYTTDGSSPLNSPTTISVPSPASGVVVPPETENFTIRAYATWTGYQPSAVATAVYTTAPDATWTRNGDGDWHDAANWRNGIVGDAPGAPVDFRSLTMTADHTVSLNAPATVGTLAFGDLGNTRDWLVQGASALTLDNLGPAPVVTVHERTTRLDLPLAGTAGLTKAGAGTLIHTGASTYSGATTIQGGILQIGNGTVNGPLSPGLYQINAGTTLFVNQATVAGSAITAGGWTTRLRGAGTVRIRLPGAWPANNWGPNLANQNLIDPGFTGTLHIELGRTDMSPSGMGGVSAVRVDSGGQFLSWSGTYPQAWTLTGNGANEAGYAGALRVAATSVATFTGPVTLAGDASMNSQDGNSIMTVSGVISGPYNLWKTASDGLLVFSAANTFSGTMDVLGGIFRLDHAQALQHSTLTGALGTVQFGSTVAGNAFSLGGLAGARPLSLTNTAAAPIALTVGGNHQNTTYASSLAGTGSLIKAGNGTLTLSASQSYLGTTTITGGTLLVNGSLPAASAVTVANGGTLGGSGMAFGTVTLNAGATLAPGADANTIGTLTTGALTLGGTYQCQVSGTTADRVTVNGNLVLTGSALAVAALSAAEPGNRIIASYTGTRSGQFASVTPGYSVTYDDANRQVLLTVSAGGNPYDSWALSKGLTAANNGKTQDPDRDGVSNLLEFYLGGEPLTANSAILPKVVAMNATSVTFGFSRLDAAEAAFPVQRFHYGSTLTVWTPVTIGATGGPGPNGITVTVTENAAAADWITVVIPRALAEGGKLFGRLFLSE